MQLVNTPLQSSSLAICQCQWVVNSGKGCTGVHTLSASSSAAIRDCSHSTAQRSTRTRTAPDSSPLLLVYRPKTVSKPEPAVDNRYAPVAMGVQLYHTDLRHTSHNHTSRYTTTQPHTPNSHTATHRTATRHGLPQCSHAVSTVHVNSTVTGANNSRATADVTAIVAVVSQCQRHVLECVVSRRQLAVLERGTHRRRRRCHVRRQCRAAVHDADSQTNTYASSCHDVLVFTHCQVERFNDTPH